MTPLHTKPPDMAQEVYEGIVVAQRLRLELGLADDQPLDCVLELAERGLALEVVLAPLTGSISGFYLPVPRTPIVVVEQTHPVQRQRFTIAHELGHHALGHAAAPRIHGDDATADASSPRIADDDRRGDGGDGDTPPTTHDARHYTPRRAPNAEERAANAFAGELLIPHDGAARTVARWTGAPPLDLAVRLSAHFGVSAFSSTVKLEVLGTLDRGAARALRRELSAGAHYPRYSALGLTPLDDALQRHADAGGGPRCSPDARRALAALRADFDALAA